MSLAVRILWAVAAVLDIALAGLLLLCFWGLGFMAGTMQGDSPPALRCRIETESTIYIALYVSVIIFGSILCNARIGNAPTSVGRFLRCCLAFLLAGILSVSFAFVMLVDKFRPSFIEAVVSAIERGVELASNTWCR